MTSPLHPWTMETRPDAAATTMAMDPRGLAAPHACNSVHPSNSQRHPVVLQRPPPSPTSARLQPRSKTRSTQEFAGRRVLQIARSRVLIPRPPPPPRRSRPTRVAPSECFPTALVTNKPPSKPVSRHIAIVIARMPQEHTLPAPVCPVLPRYNTSLP